MDSLPIKLNFFKRIEQYFELRKLDTLYKLQMREWEEKVNKAKEGESIKFTFPTWNVEKKILNWSYFHHKHLGTPLSTEQFNPDAPYLVDWNTDRLEVGLVGPEQVLKNLVAHGFADDISIPQAGVRIKINSDGLLAASILDNNYRFVDVSYGKDTYKWKLLISKKVKHVGFILLYSAAWSLVFFSLLLFSWQVISAIGGGNMVKDWFENLQYFFKVLVSLLALLPLFLFIFGALLIVIRKRPKYF